MSAEKTTIDYLALIKQRIETSQRLVTRVPFVTTPSIFAEFAEARLEYQTLKAQDAANQAAGRPAKARMSDVPPLLEAKRRYEAAEEQARLHSLYLVMRALHPREAAQLQEDVPQEAVPAGATPEEARRIQMANDFEGHKAMILASFQHAETPDGDLIEGFDAATLAQIIPVMATVEFQSLANACIAVTTQIDFPTSRRS